LIKSFTLDKGPGPRGDTIVSVPHPHGLQPLIVGEVQSESPIATSGIKVFKIRVADREGRRRSASFLVQRRYAWRGYQIDPSPGVRPNGVTLSAYDGDDVVATISVGLDSASGMFVDALFANEIDSFRLPGRRICEFTKLAVDEALRSKQVLAAIFHIAYIYARRVHACSDLFVEVNPRHVRFYERMLGFRSHGSVRMDPRVDAPAALLHLELGHAEDEIAKLGGKPNNAAHVRSLYPYFFSPPEEAAIKARLGTLG
jgi:hypothetical protein